MALDALEGVMHEEEHEENQDEGEEDALPQVKWVVNQQQGGVQDDATQQRYQ